MVRHSTGLSAGLLATTQPPPEDVKVEEGEEEEDDDDTEEPGFKLRGYQEAAVQACLDAIKDGWTRVGVSSPTGSGKTLMLASLLPHFIKRTKTGRLGKGKVLIVVGSEELGYQAEGIIDRLEERYRIKWEQGPTRAKGDCNVVITTWQTMRREKRRQSFQKRYPPSLFKLVIVDEAHHSCADSYLNILHDYNDEVQVENSKVPFANAHQHGRKIPIVGFSATFARQDGKQLAWVYQKIVFHLELEEMWASKQQAFLIAGCILVAEIISLAEVEILSAWGDVSRMMNNLPAGFDTSDDPDLLVDMDGGGPGQKSEFRKMCELAASHEFNQKIVETYQVWAIDRKATLVFCADLAYVESLTDAFKTAGIETRAVDGSTAKEERSETVEAFKNGEFPVLVNCKVFLEGADLPRIDCIVLARPTNNENTFNQMVGRGTRLSDETGKKNCLVLDLFGKCGRFKLGVEPNLQ